MNTIPQDWLYPMQRSAQLALTATNRKFYPPSPSYVKNVDRFAKSIFTDLPDLPGDFTLEMAHSLAYRNGFQNYPAICVLKPLAKKLWKTKVAFERAVIGASVGGVQPSQVKKTLREFIQVHADFETRFTEQIMELNPHEPFTVGRRFPKIVSCFKQAFKEINPSEEKIAERDPECVEKVGRLGLFICLKDPKMELSPLFSEGLLTEIVNIRKTLSEIKDSQSFYDGFLLEEFPPPDVDQTVTEAYKQIGALFYKMDRRISSAIGSLLFVSFRN